MIFLLCLLVPLCLCDVLPVARRKMSAGDKLLFAQVVWRHGDRAPTMTYPTDKHQENAWPNGWGELTQLGMRQQYALGRLLRERYMLNETNPLLSRRYNAKEVYIRSTDVNRTLISAYANIAGMFSEGVKGVDFPNYIKWPSNWTPLPVHTVDLDTDHIGNIFAPCPRANELDEFIRGSQEFTNLQRENQDFLNFLMEKTGMDKIDLTNIYLINDVHHIEKIYNMSQPDWMTADVSAKLLNLTQQANEFTYGISDPYVPEMIKLRGGSMLKALIQKMKLKYSCYKKNNQGDECSWMGPLKYYAYSAHDTTVAALLTTFGDELQVIRGGLPKYTASVAVELWDLEGEGPAVRLMFHTAFHHNYHPITHLTHGCPNDNEFCLLETFEKRSQKFIPIDIQNECSTKIKSKWYKNKLTATNRMEW